MMSRELIPQGFNGESREQEMFDFVLDGEIEDEQYNFQSGSLTEKDDDSVKLFIGQIPKDMDEDALRPYFADFGTIFELTIIRDKTTKIHRGCAFLTYARKISALHAIQELHDKIKLPNAVNPLQVRPAESQAERENKLFIGMLPKTVTEEDLENTFSQYGELREVHIIRGTDGHSKGCAFIKFMDRDSAMVAIDCVHDTTPEGSTRPLVVKFADNKKVVKGKVGGISPPDTPSSGCSVPLLMSGILNPGQGMPAEYWAMQQQQHQQGSSTQYPYSVSTSQTMVGQPVSASPSQQQQQQLVSVPYLTYPSAPGSPSYLYYQSPVSMFPQYTHAPNSPGFSSNGNGSDAFPLSGPRAASPMTPSFRGQSSGSVLPGNSSRNQSQLQSQGHAHSQVQSHSTSRPPEGPSGANLFIYHLPRDLTDADLATLFASFGNVISAKVYVDKKTAESKGFGFVSYDSVASAEDAISTMNGFQIGTKRLKVQHKRSGGNFDMGGATTNMGNTISHSNRHGQPVTYSMISSMGMGAAGVSDYALQGYGMQAGYSDSGKSIQYVPDQQSGSQSLPARAQHVVMGLEEQFSHMPAVLSSQINGSSGSGGMIDTTRRSQQAVNTSYQMQNQQRTSHQQMQLQVQQQQQMNHDVRFREL